MRFLLRSALAIGAAGVLAACTDESATVPTGPTVPAGIGSARASAITLPSSCDVGLLKTYARGYANKGSDPLFTSIGLIPAALKTDGNTRGVATTDVAFDALSRMGAIRGTSAMKPDAGKANFDLLVRGLLACTAPAVTAAAVEPPGGSFGGALTPNWVFEVRGKATASEAGGAYERGSDGNTWWGAWPKSGTWADVISSSLTDGKSPATLLGKRVLIYGYRSDNSAVPGRVGSTFQHYSIPKIDNTTFDVTATLGLCFANANDITGSSYLNHDTKFLKLEQPTSTECAAPAPFTATTAVAFGGRLNPMYLARQAANYMWPQPLYAATMDGGGSVTGTPDDWSPSAVWDLSQFVLPTTLPTITNGTVSEQIHFAGGVPVTFAVNVVGGGAAPDGTPVTVSVLGNQSVIAFFSDNGGTPGPTATRYVSGGTVSFAGVNLTKAGGYQLSFRVSFEGFGGTALNSNSFNIQNK